ncbi:flagellin [Clostridium sp. BJN0001]|uniref:flagellin n=1 Tax=Clostridium sp. BJN0001 TaxID=2930219 RepID=UPI001FD13B8C|nr:flagellin [Clostridium sp. BJN0001]
MRLAHNMYSEKIYRTYKSILTDNSKSIRNISSGLKINSAKDNPSKISESENLKMQIMCRNAAEENIQDTNSMIQTFDGSMQEINNQLVRLKQLVVNVHNDTNDDEDKATIKKEIDQILEGIDDISNNTEFNGTKLSLEAGEKEDPNSNIIKSTIGDMVGDDVKLQRYNLTTGKNGLDLQGNSTDLSKIDDAIQKVSISRSKYGAIQSRLEDTYTDMGSIDMNLQSAQSDLADADIAEEALNLSKSQIMYQASIALMAQSNKFPKEALNILSAVK